MNKERLNEIMNCKCLQSIIENDNTGRDEQWMGLRTIVVPYDKYVSPITFECSTSYRRTVIDLETNRTTYDRDEQKSCGIPFLYCPICGSRSKHEIPKDSFYYKFQTL